MTIYAEAKELRDQFELDHGCKPDVLLMNDLDFDLFESQVGYHMRDEIVFVWGMMVKTTPEPIGLIPCLSV